LFAHGRRSAARILFNAARENESCVRSPSARELAQFRRTWARRSRPASRCARSG